MSAPPPCHILAQEDPTILEACARQAAWPAATKILRRMRRRSGLQPPQLTYNLLLDALWQEGQRRDAANMMVRSLLVRGSDHILLLDVLWGEGQRRDP
eukprot:2169805-Pyramimonas_sp.AAC.1